MLEWLYASHHTRLMHIGVFSGEALWLLGLLPLCPTGLGPSHDSTGYMLATLPDWSRARQTTRLGLARTMLGLGRASHYARKLAVLVSAERDESSKLDNNQESDSLRSKVNKFVA